MKLLYKFYENFCWMFMFRVAMRVLFWYVSFFSYRHYTKQVTECTHSVVLTDFNKFPDYEISWKLVTVCRVAADKLIGMMMLHIFNFSLWMCPNDSEHKELDNNKYTVWSVSFKTDFFLITELEWSVGLPTKYYQPTSVHTSSFVCLSSTVYEL